MTLRCVSRSEIPAQLKDVTHRLRIIGEELDCPSRTSQEGHDQTDMQTDLILCSLSSFISRKTRADETLISSNHDQVSPPNMHLTFYDNIDISFIASAFLSRSSMLCYLWRVLRQPPTISKTFVVSLVREDEFTNKSFRQSQAI